MKLASDLAVPGSVQQIPQKNLRNFDVDGINFSAMLRTGHWLDNDSKTHLE